MPANVNRELFETMPVPRAAGKLMLPTVMSSLVMIIYSLSDTFFVGLLNSPVQTSAVALSTPVLLSFNAVSNLFGVGGSSMMSRALGRGDTDTVRRGAAFSFYCSLASGLLLSALCFVFFQPLLDLMGTDADTYAATAAYMRWAVLCGATPSILNVVFAYLVRSEGEALHAGIGSMSGCVLNIILDPLFILPGGLGMGAAGAGLATFISNCAACAYFFVLIFIKRKRSLITIAPKYFWPGMEMVSQVCGVGVPASIQNLLNVVSMMMLNNFAADYGAVVVAAMGIAQKINMVAIQITLGAAQGIMPLAGYCYSSRNRLRFRGTVSFALKALVPLMCVISALCCIWAPELTALFIENGEVVSHGARYLFARSIAMPFLAADFLIIGVMQAIGRGRVAFVFALLRKLVFEIPALLLLNWFLREEGIAYGTFASELVMAFLGALALRKVLQEVALWGPGDGSGGAGETSGNIS